VHVQSIGPWNILGHFFVVKFVFTTSKSLVHGSIRKTMTLNMAAMGGAQLEAVGTKLGAFRSLEVSKAEAEPVPCHPLTLQSPKLKSIGSCHILHQWNGISNCKL